MITSNTVILYDTDRHSWLRFEHPVESFLVRKIEQVLPVLERIEQRVNNEQLYAAGFVAYEAAPAFDSALHTLSADGYPLLWFGLYEKPVSMHLPNAPHSIPLHWHPSIDQHTFDQAITTIRDYIRNGQTYQVNYTFRLLSDFYGDAFDFFAHLHKAQQAEYAAFIKTDELTICSASPELFFKLDGDRLMSKPMKGTAPRGLTWEQDQQNREALLSSEKNRAENVMIVDMVRNDMGRIAETGSVEVSGLYTVEKFPSVLQMVSTVESRTRASIADIFSALFPAASITGAPKPRTMQIITELEKSPRHIYTGSIGYLAPNRQAQFNVAIRTVSIQNKKATFGVGGGIVWDSLSTDEYRETQTKAKFLNHPAPDFTLLETMLLQADRNIFLLDLHMDRLKKSADYFSYPLNEQQMLNELLVRIQELEPGAHKIRLLLSCDGQLEVQFIRLSTVNDFPLKVSIAKSPVNAQDVFLYHKTTHRQVYKHAQNSAPDMDDVLLFNEKGYVTEFCVGNVVYKLNGHLYTPPVADGLLAGTFRQFLLNEHSITERSLPLTELAEVQALYLINSVQKWRKVELWSAVSA